MFVSSVLYVAVLPAYAGMIPLIKKPCTARYGAPRIRGDDPVTMQDTENGNMCSPHTRG